MTVRELIAELRVESDPDVEVVFVFCGAQQAEADDVLEFRSAVRMTSGELEVRLMSVEE